MRGKKFSIGLRALAIVAVTLLVTSTWAATNWREKVLHNFGNGTDGVEVYAGLVRDAAGNLYGTTYQGGTGSNCGVGGCGTVFELIPTGGGWTEQVLHNFNNDGTDGFLPYAGLILDAEGNLYGTTVLGGTYGPGTVFELSPTAGGGWTEQVLYSFCPQTNCPDGSIPYAGLVFDAAGNLYGTAEEGGTYGYGTVFKLSPGNPWTETVLYSFCAQTNCTDGGLPDAGLIFDAAGNLYGTTRSGGDYGGGDAGPGTVFELTAAGTETVLHSFGYFPTDGLFPYAGLTFDTAGNLYSTTIAGGSHLYGTVFKLTPAGGGIWTEQVLHSFSNNGTDGFNPSAGLIFDAAGNLYSTTSEGGAYNYAGTVFELSPAGGGNWTETVLYNFGANGQYDGSGPRAGLVSDAAGNLYGTTAGGGIYSCVYSCGTVFELTPLYPCAVCSHAADRELNVLPVER